jgi:hypothetical protein
MDNRRILELELTRSPRDRRLYVLGDLGSLRFAGLFSRSAVAETAGQSWRFARRGVFTSRAEAADAAGTVIGRFEPRSVRRGGAIEWSRKSLVLRPASAWRERYALVDGDRELAIFDGKGWGRKPVRVEIDEAGPSDAKRYCAGSFP